MSDKPKCPPRGLTNNFIESLRPSEKAYDVPDNGSGVVVRVEPSGAKSLRYQNRSTGLVTSMPWAPEPMAGHATLKQWHGWVLRFKEARRAGVQQLRDEITQMRLQLRPGPASAQPDRPTGFTVRYVAERWYHSRIERRRKQPNQVRSLLDNYILPARDPRPEAHSEIPFGDFLIREVTPLDCGIPVEFAMSRKREGTAPSVLKHVKQLFKYATRRGFVAGDVSSTLMASDFGLHPQMRQRALTAEELPLFWNAFTPGQLARTVAALRVILLTGVRVSQFCKALWRNVDLDKRLWTIPFEDRKFTRAMAEQMREKKPFIIPLSPLAVAFFRELKSLAGVSAYVLPMRGDPDRPRRYVGLDVVMEQHFGVWHDLPPRVPLPGGTVTIHDLRRTMRTHLTGPELRVPLHIAERCLDHSLGKIVNTYDVSIDDYLPERRDALERWAAYVQRLTTHPSVIPLHAVR